MDSKPAGNVALLSIRPEYATSILAGEKQWEFRKVKFRRPISHLLLYACHPVRKLVGIATVRQVVCDHPESLWLRCHEHGGVNKHVYAAYYQSAVSGVAVQLGHVEVFGEPFDLAVIMPGARPPQSFQYLPSDALQLLDNLRTICGLDSA